MLTYLRDIEEFGHLVVHHTPEIIGGFLGYLVHEWKHVGFRALKRAMRMGGHA